MDAKIDPKVVMDLSIFKIGGWSELQPSDHKSLEKFTEENMPQLLVGFLKQRSILCYTILEGTLWEFRSTLKNLISFREGLRVMIQYYKRQHSADFYWLHEHLGGPASWRESMTRKLAKESTTYYIRGPVCKWNIHMMQSEYVRKTTGFFTNSWSIPNRIGELFLQSLHGKFGRETG